MDIFDINDLDNIIDFSHVKEEKNNKHIVIDKKDIAPVKKLKSIKKEPECTCPISPDLIDVNIYISS